MYQCETGKTRIAAMAALYPIADRAIEVIFENIDLLDR